MQTASGEPQTAYNHRQSFDRALDQAQERLGALAGKMDKVGLTEDWLLGRVREQAEADDLRLASDHGEFTDIMAVPNHTARGQAIELALRLRGLLKQDSAPSPANISIVISAAPPWAPPTEHVGQPTPNVTLEISAEQQHTGTSTRSTIEGTGPSPASLPSSTLPDRMAQPSTSTISVESAATRRQRLKREARLPVAGKRYGTTK